MGSRGPDTQDASSAIEIVATTLAASAIRRARDAVVLAEGCGNRLFSVVGAAGFPLEVLRLVRRIGRVGVVDDTMLAGERHEALAPRAADQREVRLLRKLDAP